MTYLPRGAYYVIAIVFDSNVVVSRNKWGVADFVSFLHLSTVHGHLGGTVYGYGQSARTSIASVHNEISFLTCIANASR